MTDLLLAGHGVVSAAWAEASRGARPRFRPTGHAGCDTRVATNQLLGQVDRAFPGLAGLLVEPALDTRVGRLVVG